MKRKLLILCAAVMMLNCVACSTPSNSQSSTSQSGNSQSSSSQASAEQPSNAEPQTITAIMRLPADFIVEGNPVIEAWGERTGVKIEVEAPPISNYMDRLNIVMASGDLPDLIYVQNMDSTYNQWCRDGLLLDLTDYFNESTMPTASHLLSEEEVAGCYVDGHLYSLPRVQAKPLDCILYRGDWLDKLNLEVPTTPSEFAAVMEAFTTQDPDGNGINDTYGLSFNTTEDRNFINAFNLRPRSVPDEKGEYRLMQAQDGYIAYLDWLHDMYAAGSLDPEWYLIQSSEDTDMFHAGKIGCFYTNCQINLLVTTLNNDTFKASNPGARLVVGPALMPEGSKVSNVYYPPQIWGSYAINADSEHVDAVIKLLDDGYTTECTTLLFKGIEGEHYTSLDPETRILTATEEQANVAKTVASSYLCINYETEDRQLVINGGTATNAEDVATWLAANEYVQGLEKRIAYLPESESSVPGISDANLKLTNDGVVTSLSEKRTQYICGQISRDEMVAFLQEYETAHAEVMSLISASGINK